MKTLNRSMMKAVVGLTVLVAAGAAMADSQVYVQIENIKGESRHAGHEEWIEAQAFSQGIANPVSQSSGSGGRSAGGAHFDDLTLLKRVDLASPELWIASARGEHLREIRIEVFRSPSDRFPYLTIELFDVVISSVQHVGIEGGEYLEELSLNFGQIQFTYQATDDHGGEGPSTTRGWDVERNCAI